MRIPISTVPAAKAYLVEKITKALANPKVLVSYDDPGPNQPDDIIVVGDVNRTITPWAMVGGGGAGWLGENYTITVTVSVFRGGDFAQAVTERAYELADLIVAVVRQDPSLGGLVLTARPEATQSGTDWTDDHKGRVTTLPITFLLTAQI